MDLSVDAQEHPGEEEMVDDPTPKTHKALDEPLRVQLFDIPQKVPVLSSSTRGAKAGFLGYCLDSGASRSVVGEQQYRQLYISTKHQLQLKTSDTLFKFGNTTFPSLRKFTTRLKVSGERYLEMEIEAVSGDFPLLICLEIMKLNLHGLVLYYGQDRLSDNISQ